MSGPNNEIIEQQRFDDSVLFIAEAVKIVAEASSNEFYDSSDFLNRLVIFCFSPIFAETKRELLKKYPGFEHFLQLESPQSKEDYIAANYERSLSTAARAELIGLTGDKSESLSGEYFFQTGLTAIIYSNQENNLPNITIQPDKIKIKNQTRQQAREEGAVSYVSELITEKKDTKDRLFILLSQNPSNSNKEVVRKYNEVSLELSILEGRSTYEKAESGNQSVTMSVLIYTNVNEMSSLAKLTAIENPQLLSKQEKEEEKERLENILKLLVGLNSRAYPKDSAIVKDFQNRALQCLNKDRLLEDKFEDAKKLLRDMILFANKKNRINNVKAAFNSRHKNRANFRRAVKQFSEGNGLDSLISYLKNHQAVQVNEIDLLKSEKALDNSENSDSLSESSEGLAEDISDEMLKTSTQDSDQTFEDSPLHSEDDNDQESERTTVTLEDSSASLSEENKIAEEVPVNHALDNKAEYDQDAINEANQEEHDFLVKKAKEAQERAQDFELALQYQQAAKEYQSAADWYKLAGKIDTSEEMFLQADYCTKDSRKSSMPENVGVIGRTEMPIAVNIPTLAKKEPRETGILSEVETVKTSVQNGEDTHSQEPSPTIEEAVSKSFSPMRIFSTIARAIAPIPAFFSRFTNMLSGLFGEKKRDNVAGHSAPVLDKITQDTTGQKTRDLVSTRNGSEVTTVRFSSQEAKPRSLWTRVSLWSEPASVSPVSPEPVAPAVASNHGEHRSITV